MSQQFLVQLPNRPGELSHLARALCARGVNIVQIREVTVGDQVRAEIFTDCCDDDTQDVLHSMGYQYARGTSVTVDIEDTPCAFAEVNDRLRHAGVHVKGFCVITRGDGHATWALEVDKEDLARSILEQPVPGKPASKGAAH
jgi:hypothetical protein